MSFTNYNQCSLLLPLDGVNNGTTFTDWSVSPKTISVFGNAKSIVTGDSKYYGSCLSLDGTGDYLTSPRAIPVTGDFTVSIWIRPAVSGDLRIITQRTLLSANPGRLGIYIGPGGVASVFLGSTTNMLLESTTVLPINAWTHIAVTRGSNVFRIFVDGVLENTSGTVTQSIEDTITYIGRYNSNATLDFNGLLQDILILSGVALWTSDFTPPTRLVGQLDGVVKDKDDVVAARGIRAHVGRSVSSFRTFTTTSSAIDGTYSLRVPATEVTRIALADETELYNDIVDRIVVE